AYDWGEVVRTYSGVEPRFAANYQLNDVSSAKLSYNRTRQFIHLISNTTSPTPIDVWRPSGEYIEPATADQIALGYFRNFSDNQFEASAEVYYKHFQGLVDYKAGAELILNERLETELLSGTGDAYGVELQIKKRKGLLTGWISYTLARSERDIPGINNDEPYPSNYDRLHDLSVVAIYPISEKLKLGANFAFTSGRAITYPDSRYVVQGIQVPNYNNRNGERAPSYHRLDLSLTYTPKPNSNKRWKGEWVFSVYNVYNRRNPFSVYFRQDADNPTRTEAVRLSVFGSIVPAVTYNFQF
ncbi:MAG: TonB-dependent receptor, partial [Bacteroidota bacterium]